MLMLINDIMTMMPMIALVQKTLKRELMRSVSLNNRKPSDELIISVNLGACGDNPTYRYSLLPKNIKKNSAVDQTSTGGRTCRADGG